MIFIIFSINFAYGFDPIPPMKGWNLEVYNNWTEMETWIKEVVGGSDLDVRVETIGVTDELRNIYVIEIAASKPEYKNLNSGAIVIQCGLIAREWSSSQFCQFLVHSILWGSYQHLREYTNIVILPMMNPPGLN